MPIDSVHMANFKGIASARRLEIKPITVFVGANSSGKSSCIHALAALSQTVKITNDSRPLVLDDEFATVHLGRFIEIIHSRSYQDLIELGLGFEKANYEVIAKAEKEDQGYRIKTTEGKVLAVYSFKCTKITQEVKLESARLEIGLGTYAIKRTGQKYLMQATLDGGPELKASTNLESAFFLSSSLMYRQDRLEAYYPLQQIQRLIKDELSKTLYLGPFRQGPLRRYATRGSGPTEVGPLGESTITMLANETIQSRSRAHIKQVARWLKELGLARAIEVERVGRSDLFDVSITLNDGKAFPLADLGYGLSQVLPVLTQCSFAPVGATLLFEQPEIHLHTISATKLASVFKETAHDKKAHVVIETHSPQLVKAFIQLLKSKELSRDEIVIYKVARENGQSRTDALEFDEEFDVYENWEKGISVG